MDSLIKALTIIGIVAGIGVILTGSPIYMNKAFGIPDTGYCTLLNDLKTQKTLIKEQAEDVNEIIAMWVKQSASMEDLRNYSAQLVSKKEALDAEEERKIAEERLKITFKGKIPHDGEQGGTIPITLDASKSTPTEAGDEMTWNWVSTDGKVQIEDQGAKEISFDAEAGNYNFQLTLTDSYGASSSELRIVDIEGEDNKAPQIVIEKK